LREKVVLIIFNSILRVFTQALTKSSFDS